MSARHRREAARNNRSGFTLVELLIVTVIVAILAALAVPTYHGMIVRARAAQVISDFNTVKIAAYDYFAERNDWPPDNYPGIVPPQLAPYLPTNFSFNHDGYELDWENWILPDGTPMHPDTHVLLGVSVTTQDQDLADAVLMLLGKTTAHYTLGNNYTYVIQGM